MKKLSLTLAVLVLAMISSGCAQVDYPCITDSSQTGNSTGFVSTNGKAHIAEFVQSAIILGDGSVHEIVNFLDQNVTGNGGVVSDLYNYDHSAPDEASFIFHDDQFCNTEWTSCSAATNTDNAFCGADGKGGISINFNQPCTDGLFLLFGDSVRDNECGNAAVTDPQPKLAGLTITEALGLIADNSSLATGIDGETWHRMTLNPRVTFSYDSGAVYDLALPAAGIPVDVRLTAGFRFRALVDLSSPEFGGVLHDLQAIADENPGGRFGITVEIFGRTLDLSGSFRLVDSELAPGFYSDKASRLYGG